MMQKKLYRSTQNRMLAGILGGIGEYLNIDPTVVRVVFIALWIATAFFPCAIAYVLMWFIVPEQRV